MSTHVRTSVLWLFLGLTAACNPPGPSGSDGAVTDGTSSDTAPTDAATSDVVATDGPAMEAGPPPTGNLVDEAISTCVWTSACLTSGGAPNSNVGSCIGSFIAQHSTSAGLLDPWDDYKACVAAGPRDCETFRQCLLARAAICALPRTPGQMPDWTKGGLCANGTRSCTDLACLSPSCTGTQPACSSDGTRVDQCSGSVGRRVPCSRPGFAGRCVSFGGTDQCVAGTIGTCTGGPSVTCDGTVAVRCAGGIEGRFDCAQFGQTCAPGTGCVRGTACTYMDDACNGNTLRTCFDGVVKTVDCAALGGTCGQTRISREACVLPAGSPPDAGVDAGVDARAETGVDAATQDATSTPEPGPEAGAQDAGADAASACNTLTLQPSSVTPTRVTGAVPAATGGTIVDGTYYLTGWVLYDGAGNDTMARKETISISGSRLDSARDYSLSGGMNPSRLNLTATPSGTTLMLASTCPAAGTNFNVGYTATSTTLTLVQSNRTQVYTRQ